MPARKYVSTIVHVDNNYNGCFVACVAMLLGLDYNEAFKKVFPKRNGPQENYGGACSPQLALKKLARLGFKPRLLPTKQNALRLQQTSLIWLRWSPTSSLMHSLIYEKESNQFIDPNYFYPITDRLRLNNINRFKENVVALDGYVPPAVRLPGYKPPTISYEYNDYDLY